MGYLLSVDGGGSSTSFLLTDRQGRTVRSIAVGSSSFKSVGHCQAQENIALGLTRLEVPLAEIEQGIWGLSGCDTENDQHIYEAMLTQCGLETKHHRVINDAIIAFWAAAQPPGVVIIAGTGSIALGIPRQGAPLRCGGLNYAFSDLGSGYWMGSRLLQESALYLEGLREFDPVFSAVIQRLGEAPLDTLAQLENADQIASFAKLVLESDSPVCVAIRQAAAGFLIRYGSRMLEALGSNTVVLAGGLFQNDRFYQLTAAGFPHAQVVRPTLSPVFGGIQMLLTERKIGYGYADVIRPDGTTQS